MKLNMKLILSYVFISMFLVLSLLIVSNYALKNQFKQYKQINQEKENKELVAAIAEEFSLRNKPDTMFFNILGIRTLSKGLILTVYDDQNEKIFSMESVNESACKAMLIKMEANMKNLNSKFDGTFREIYYPIMKDGQTYGKVRLGFYGPFYYQDEDIAFIGILNNLFILTGTIFLIIAIGLGIVMASRISEPLKKVTQKTNLIGKGNFSDRIASDTNTKEIVELIHSVNTLASDLEEQQNIKTQMARDYAHEFRTPLATLQSNLEAMIDGIFDTTKERLESCNEEILRLSRMVSNIDKIVEIENNQTVLYKETFDINASIENIVKNFENELFTHKIKVTTHLKSGFINADKDQINQVILNLLTNAIKFTEENGEIEITTINVEKNVLIVIKDNGQGILQEELPKIFEHLYRCEKSRTRKHCSKCDIVPNSLSCSLCSASGSGIGLSIVKAIVKSHGGKIDVQSKVGIGSEFRVTLPQ